jgi:hypothetical protein
MPPDPTNATCPRFRGRLLWPLLIQGCLAALSLLAVLGLLTWILAPLLMRWLSPHS